MARIRIQIIFEGHFIWIFEYLCSSLVVGVTFAALFGILFYNFFSLTGQGWVSLTTDLFSFFLFLLPPYPEHSGSLNHWSCRCCSKCLHQFKYWLWFHGPSVWLWCGGSSSCAWLPGCQSPLMARSAGTWGRHLPQETTLYICPARDKQTTPLQGLTGDRPLGLPSVNNIIAELQIELNQNHLWGPPSSGSQSKPVALKKF